MPHAFNSTAEEVREHAENLCLNPKVVGDNKVEISSVGTFDEAFLHSRATMFFILGIAHQSKFKK
jgi:hypothetical protein